jgi:hypothetical protein
MSASKKNSNKSTSPAPASKLAAAKPAAIKQTAAAPTVRATAKTPVAMLAPTPAPAATAAVKPAVAAPAAKPVKTTITARYDVGFGNALFVRGEGPGLSWDKGLAMANVGADLWQVSLPEGARAYTFKFLVNDVTWSAGPDFTAACGTSVTLTPEF